METSPNPHPSANPDNVYNRLTAAATGLGGSPVTLTGTTTVSFSSDILTILLGCSGCHHVEWDQFGETGADSYDGLTTGQFYVIPGDSINPTNPAIGTNMLWRKPGGQVSHSGGTFDANIVTIIKAWVGQGAPEN